MATVLSPVTHKPATLINVIPGKVITDIYTQEINMDVSAYFKNVPEVSLYQCQQTGYRFFYPLTLSGDAEFYEILQKYPWYYADWKWDYDAALPFIDNGSKVLDIGCGYGNFLLKLKKDKNCDCTGLEFNDKAILTGRERGITMHKDPIEVYAKTHKELYDYVCFFQVLEHIADIDSFMTAAIECLKPGGKLLICVPNNNPHFFKYYEYHSLNMPPHHMGLWNEETFRNLANVYPLKIKAAVKEKLKRYRFFTRLYIENAAGKSSFKKVMMNLFKLPITAYFLMNRKNIEAGSILMVYEKK